MKTLPRTLVLVIALLSLAVACKSSAAQAGGASGSQLNTSRSGLALDGYDPATYFSTGGGVPLPGDPSLTADLHGATYRFANAANRDSFLSDPEAFAPAYGGWCAWAMADNDKVEIDPESFLIEDGRLLVFYDGLFGDTRKSWLEGDGEELGKRADRHWAAFVGEPVAGERAAATAD